MRSSSFVFISILGHVFRNCVKIEFSRFKNTQLETRKYNIQVVQVKNFVESYFVIYLRRLMLLPELNLPQIHSLVFIDIPISNYLISLLQQLG